MNNNQHYTKEYVWINPATLIPAPEYLKYLRQESDCTDEASLNRYNNPRVLPPVAVKRIRDEQETLDVIDAMPTVTDHQLAGTSEILICIITFEPGKEDVLSLMLRLQRNKRTTLPAKYNLICAWRETSVIRQGYRGQLELEPQVQQVIDKIKHPKWYDYVAAEMGWRANDVKYIFKVGTKNPLLFERIELGRYSLYAAYCDCKDTEEGKMPEPPKIKQPTYISTSTNVPTFSEPSTTEPSTTEPSTTEPQSQQQPDDAPTNEVPDNEPGQNNPDDAGAIEDNTHVVESGNVVEIEPDYIMVEGVCQICGEWTKIKINRNQLKS